MQWSTRAVKTLSHRTAEASVPSRDGQNPFDVQGYFVPSLQSGGQSKHRFARIRQRVRVGFRAFGKNEQIVPHAR